MAAKGQSFAFSARLRKGGGNSRSRDKAKSTKPSSRETKIPDARLRLRSVKYFYRITGNFNAIRTIRRAIN